MAVREARELLPRHPSQLDAILEVHSVHVNPTLPTYDTEAMHQWARQLYLPSHAYKPAAADAEDSDEATRLAWVCAVMAAVYEVVAPIRLILWGIVDDDAESVPELTRRCIRSSSDCFRAALAAGCSTRHLVQAGISLLSTPWISFSPARRSAILDACIRIARRLGLDSLGRGDDVHEDRERVTGRALWLALVAADWDAAPFNGSYTIFPSTFTSEWCLDMDTVQRDEQNSDPAWLEDRLRMCMWPWFIRIATAARLLCEAGVNDAMRRNDVDYGAVLRLDGKIQAYLDVLPEYLRVDVKREMRRDGSNERLKKRLALRIQSCHIASGFHGTLLSLHLPYLIKGYTDPLSAQVASVDRAVLMAGFIAKGTQRMAQKSLLMDRTWRFRHRVFQAGLVLLLDLLLLSRPTSRETSEKLAFIIDALGDVPRQVGQADLSGRRLKRLLVDGIKNRGSGRPIVMFEDCVAEYAGRVYRDPPPAAPAKKPSFAAATTTSAPITMSFTTALPTPPMTMHASPPLDSSALLDSLLAFTASDEAGPSVEDILSDPFLFGL